MIFMATSAWPLLQGLVGALVQWSKFQSVANSAKRAHANWGPLSLWSDSGMPCSANSSFRMDIALAALHWDGGILWTKGIFE